MNEQPKKYSQGDEETIILDFFKHVPCGTLIDIGAYSAEAFSNSRALIDRGWSAALIEASPRCFANLMKAYRDNPRVTLINAFINDQEGFVKFYDSEGAVGTAVQSQYEAWKGAQLDYQPIVIPAIPAEKLMNIIGPVDFVNIDCEGTDIKIVKSLNWRHHNPKMVCIEAGPYQVELNSIFRDFGYSLHRVTQENLIFVK